MNTNYFNQREKRARENYLNDKSLPHRYVFILTNKCNLRCNFCFQDKSNLPGSLNLKEWKSVADQLPKGSWVTLTGGEPLAFEKFDEIFLHINKRFKNNIISNGLLLNKKKIDLVLSQKNFRGLSISVDNIYNTIRDVKKFQWDHVERMLFYFNKKKSKLKRKVILDVKTVVLDENAPDLFEIYKYCIEDLSADTHSFQFLKGAPIQFSDKIFQYEKIFEEVKAQRYLNFEIIKNQLLKVAEYNSNKNKLSFLHPKLTEIKDKNSVKLDKIDLLNKYDYDPKNFLPCMSPWESVHINTDGNIFPCMAVSMGNIKHDTLKKIINGPVFQKFRKDIKKYGTVQGCNRCGYLRV